MPSPNFGDRRGRAIDALILHYTGMASGDVALARLCDPDAEVSCHYLVWEDGRIDQLVAEADRAWHAGRSFWAGETDLNSCSIGIEVVNGGHDHGLPAFPPAQTRAVAALAKDICRRHHIPAARALGHSDIAPDRKQDPGERFPWPELAAAGVGAWVEPMACSETGGLKFGDAGEAVTAMQTRLAAFGYACASSGVFDAATRDVVVAFQRHWRPARIDGVVEASTVASLDALLERRVR